MRIATVEMSHVLVIVSGLTLAAIECGRRALARLGADRAIALAQSCGAPRDATPALPGDDGGWYPTRSLRDLTRRRPTWMLGTGAGLLAGLAALHLMGPFGLAVGTAVGASLPRLLHGRKIRKRDLELERQLADVAEATAMAVRSGFSIAQGLELAAEEAVAPMSEILARFVQEQRLGTPFEDALRRFGDGLGTPDARLFALVVSIHARSGGNLAGALDEVAHTIRHRIDVRRELRALSAQGRISGSILGALPIAFFLVLAATSHRELAPVYRSTVGMAMVSAGLVMEGLAFLWIRRLLRVEA